MLIVKLCKFDSCLTLRASQEHLKKYILTITETLAPNK